LTSKSIDNGWGTGDWDYTGEYKACVVNNSKEPMIVHNGDRVCQIAVRRAPKISFKIVKELKKTERGSNGFGSTGVKG
jgi:dUTP pyrophosphatase